jgi:hypothetical protein
VTACEKISQMRRMEMGSVRRAYNNPGQGS